MASLKDRLQQDLTDAMRARDDVRRRTIRMALTAVSNAEVSGDSSRRLSDDEVLTLLATEAKRRRESADVYTRNGRDDLAEQELLELAVVEKYLPSQLGDDELTAIVDEVIAETGVSSPRQMGVVMKAVLGRVGKQADGGRVSAVVRSRLSG